MLITALRWSVGQRLADIKNDVYSKEVLFKGDNGSHARQQNLSYMDRYLAFDQYTQTAIGITAMVIRVSVLQGQEIIVLTVPIRHPTLLRIGCLAVVVTIRRAISQRSYR